VAKGNDTQSSLEINAGPGSQRAAAVLLGLGPEITAVIFKDLDERTVEQIAAGARALRKTPGMIPEALENFIRNMTSLTSDAYAGEGPLREATARAKGLDVAKRIFDGPPVPETSISETFNELVSADPESLAMLLQRELPQTAAVVISILDRNRALAVLKHIPVEKRPNILRRLATLESITPDVLREVGQGLSEELNASVPANTRRVDGRLVAVDLLRAIPAAQQSEVVGEIEKDDPELAAALRGRLFTFNDLINLSDRDMQSLIREIDMSQLSTALKGAPDTIKTRFTKNMSSRAGQMLEDEIEAMGPVKLAAVEAAQTELVKAAFNLAEQGRITIVNPTDKMV
jgi:flagellar motor switch protein FliG